MIQGQCLCGAVTWALSGEPKGASHCHCSMCRKAHGSAFATYCFVAADDFKWLGGRDTIRDYRSSAELVRSFCGRCGSVVPAIDEDDVYFVPAGSHGPGERIDGHIFVASKAPWFEITDDLPRYNEYPPDGPQVVIAERERPPAEPGVVRGSCLCGAVEFDVIEPFKAVYNCHCGRCRRARAAAFATNGFTARAGVVFRKGEERLAGYKLPEARYFRQVFCDTCGSTLPRLDAERDIAVTPFGALDDPPGATAQSHLFVADKADWLPINDGLTRFDGNPG